MDEKTNIEAESPIPQSAFRNPQWISAVVLLGKTFALDYPHVNSGGASWQLR